MEKTANYGLPKWAETDPIKMDDFNAAFGKIDEKLKANAEAVATKAEASAHPSTLSCGFYSVLMIVTTVDKYSNIFRAFAVRGVDKFEGGAGSRKNLITWNDRGVSWRSMTETDSYYNTCDVRFNMSGVTYQYLLSGFDQ